MTGFVLIFWSSLKTISGVFWRVVKKSPGCYVLAGVLLLAALWVAQAVGFRAGVAAQKQAAAQHAVQIAKITHTVAARAEAASVANLRLVYRDKEVVRYVTQHAASLPDRDAVCISADLADRLRGLE